MFPEFGGVIVDRVGKHATHANDFGCRDDPSQRVLQQIKTQACAPVGEIAGQSADDRHRYLIWNPLLPLQFGRQRLSFNTAGSDAVITDDAVVFARHVGADRQPFAF